MTTTKERIKPETEKESACRQLRERIKPGDTVYTVLRHVSASGMTRGIDVYLITGKDEPVWITGLVGKAIDQPQPESYWRKSLGLRVGGCGMDMGFHVVNSLSYALYGAGYRCLGQGKCPASYHVNYKSRITCFDEKDCKLPLRLNKKYDHGITHYHTNPEKERFDLDHKDGYALRHKWL